MYIDGTIKALVPIADYFIHMLTWPVASLGCPDGARGGSISKKVKRVLKIEPEIKTTILINHPGIPLHLRM
jgi:hypothetical protein